MTFDLFLRLACTTCDEELQARIFDEHFPLVLLGMTAPFVISSLAAWFAGRLQ